MNNWKEFLLGLSDPKLDTLDELRIQKIRESLHSFSKGYHAKRRKTLKTIRAKYLSKNIELNPFRKRRFDDMLIKSSQGTGKTELAIDLVFNQKFIYVVHRQQLTKNVYRRFKNANIDCDLYSDLADTGEIFATANSIVICIDSIYKLKPEHYKDALLIIDEVDQVTEHLHGGTCKKDRKRILASLFHLSKQAKRRVFMSADIRPSTYHFIENFLQVENYTEYHNVYESLSNIRGYSHKTKESLIDHMTLEMQNAGGKISVSCTSEKTARRLHEHFKKALPHKRGLLITQKTKNFADVKCILDNPVLAQGYDYVIYTSVIFTGIDFNFDFSKNHYLIADNLKTHNHYDLVQSCIRFRKISEIHYYIINNKEQKFTSPIEIMKRDIRKEKYNEELTTFDFNEAREKIQTEFREFYINYSIVKSESHNSRQDLRNNFETLLRERGVKTSLYFEELETVCDITGLDVLTETGERQDKIKRELKALHEEQKAIERERILNAQEIGLEEAQEIEEEGGRTQGQNDSLLKFKYRQAIGFDGTEQAEEDLKEAVNTHLELLTRNVSNLEKLLMSKEEVEAIDQENREKYLKDRSYHLNAWTIRTEIESILQGFSMQPGDFFEPIQLAKIRNYIVENRQLITDNLFEVKDSHIEKPVTFVRSYYKQLGISLDFRIKSQGKGKARFRLYSLNEQSKEFILRAIARRQSISQGGSLNSYSIYKSKNPVIHLSPELQENTEYHQDKIAV